MLSKLLAASVAVFAIAQSGVEIQSELEAPVNVGDVTSKTQERRRYRPFQPTAYYKTWFTYIPNHKKKAELMKKILNWAASEGVDVTSMDTINDITDFQSAGTSLDDLVTLGNQGAAGGNKKGRNKNMKMKRNKKKIVTQL